MKEGEVGKVYATAVAIIHEADGSVTVCREIAEEISASKSAPKWIREIFNRPDFIAPSGSTPKSEAGEQG